MANLREQVETFLKHGKGIKVAHGLFGPGVGTTANVYLKPCASSRQSKAELASCGAKDGVESKSMRGGVDSHLLQPFEPANCEFHVGRADPPVPENLPVG